ncbi:Sulfur carrier protein ThiS [Crateriforma conspicua]|nr:Sulfur carrier protein ThiS [Crateriforma conspicua]
MVDRHAPRITFVYDPNDRATKQRTMIHLTVNGEPTTVEKAMSVRQLLNTVDVPPNYLAVEVNEEVVPREDYDNHVVNDGDRVEVVTLVGGG